MRDCYDCPCMNNDNEWGCECNLGYTLKTFAVNGAVYYVSDDCKLINIVTSEGEILPKEIDDPRR